MADDASRDASSEYIAIRFRLTDRDQFLSEFKSVQNAIGAAIKSVEKATAAAQREISKNLQKQSMGIRDAGMGLDRYLTDIDKKLAPVPTRLGKIFDGVVVPAGRMAKNVGTAFVAMSDGIEKTVKRASRSILNLRNLVVGVLAAQIGKAVLKMGADFEQGMAEVSTLVDTATTSVQGLKDGLLDLSQRVPQDVGDLTGALYQAISAGIDPSKALQFVEASAKAATAGVSDAATAVDLFTTVINSYGFAVDDVGKISDIVFEMIRLGKTDLDRIAQSMGYVASQGKLANVSFEEMAAAMTALTLAGRTTEQAAQELNQLLIKITGPTEIAKKEAEKLGIAWDESTLAAKGLFGFMEELSKRTDISAESMKHLTEDAGAMRAMAILIGPGLEKFRTLLDNMGDAAGATDRAFQKMMGTLTNLRQLLVNKIRKAFIEVFAASENDLKDFARQLGDLFDRNTDTIKEWSVAFVSALKGGFDWLLKYGYILADIGKTMVKVWAFGKVISALKIVYDLAYKIGLTFKGYAGLIGAATLAIYEAIKAFREMRAAQRDAEEKERRYQQRREVVGAVGQATSGVNAAFAESMFAAEASGNSALINQVASERQIARDKAAIEAATQAYETLIEDANAARDSARAAALVEEQQAEIAYMREQYRLRDEARAQAKKEEESAKKKTKKSSDDEGDDSVAQAIEAYRQQLEARKQAHMDELQIAKAYYDKLLSMEGVTAAQRAQIEEIYQDTVTQIHADIAEEEKAANFEAFKAKFEALQDDLQKERDAADDRVAVIEREKRYRLKVIDDILEYQKQSNEADLIGYREYLRLKKQIEDKANEDKKKAEEDKARDQRGKYSGLFPGDDAVSEFAFEFSKSVYGALKAKVWDKFFGTDLGKKIAAAAKKASEWLNKNIFSPVGKWIEGTLGLKLGGLIGVIAEKAGGIIQKNIISPINNVLGDIESLTGLETKTSLGTDYQRDPRLDSQFAATRDEARRDMLSRYYAARERGDYEAARRAQRGEIATGTGVEQSPISAAMDDIEMRVKGWVPRAISALRAMGARLPGILQGAARRMASMRGELLSAIRKNVPAILGAAANAATEFAVTQFQILTVKLPSYVLTAAVIAGRALLRLVPAVIRALPDAIRTLIDVTADLLPELISEIILMIPDIVLAWIEALPRIWDAIIIKGIPKIIGALVETILVAVPRAFSKAISGTVDSLAKVFGSAAWRGLRDAFKKVIDWLKKQLDKITPDVPSIGGDLSGLNPFGGDPGRAANNIANDVGNFVSSGGGLFAKGGVAGTGHTPAYASAVARLNRLMSSPNEVAGLMYRGEMVLDTATSQKLMAALGGTNGTIDRNGQRGTIDRNGFGDQVVNIHLSAEVLASRSAGDWLDDALYKLSRQPGRKININPDKGAR